VAEQRRGQVQDQRGDDLARLGVPAAQAQAWLERLGTGEPEPDDLQAHTAAGGPPVVLWPENQPAWRVWMRLQRQWHRGAAGQLYALRLPAVESAIRLMGLAEQQQVLFEHLSEMEHEALSTLEAMEALDAPTPTPATGAPHG
jgi:hypothetical protein